MIEISNFDYSYYIIIRTSISHDEVMDVMVGVGIPGLKGKHVSVRRCIQLDDCLHR